MPKKLMRIGAVAISGLVGPRKAGEVRGSWITQVEVRRHGCDDRRSIARGRVVILFATDNDLDA
jgi:hypothetical protein